MYRNAAGRGVPDHLRRIADAVHRLVRRADRRAWWRQQVRQWCRGEVGDNAGAVARWRTPGAFDPFPQALEPVEQRAVLAAVHDHCSEAGVELLGPDDRRVNGKPTITRPGAKFWVLRVVVGDYGPEHAQELRRCLRDVRRRLCPPFRFAADFRAVRWGDEMFTFTARQAAVVKYMHRAGIWQGGDTILVKAAELSESEQVVRILESLAYTPRLRDLFKVNPAWGRLIVAHPTTLNLFALAQPPEPTL